MKMAFGIYFVIFLFLLAKSLAQEVPVTGSRNPFDNPVEADTTFSMSVCVNKTKLNQEKNIPSTLIVL